MNFFDPRQTDSGESGKRVNYRNLVIEQCRLADELGISWIESTFMSVLDRKYAFKYLETKSTAIKKMYEDNKKRVSAKSVPKHKPSHYPRPQPPRR